MEGNDQGRSGKWQEGRAGAGFGLRRAVVSFVGQGGWEDSRRSVPRHRPSDPSDTPVRFGARQADHMSQGLNSLAALKSQPAGLNPSAVVTHNCHA